MVEDWQDGKTIAECNLYMLTNEIACDVTFLVGRREDAVLSHTFILNSRAPKLCRLYADQQRFQNKLVILPDVDTQPFRQLLRYVYSDEFDLTSRNAMSLLPVASKYGPMSLTTCCFEQILSDLTVENVSELLELGHEFNARSYVNKCLEYIFDNAKDVLTSPSFTILCRDCVAKVVKSDDLYTEELTVYNALITWANSRCSEMKIEPIDQNRRRVLGNLLYHVRYTQMNVEEFTENVSTRKVLASDEKLKIFQYYQGSSKSLPEYLTLKPRRKRTLGNVFGNTGSKGLKHDLPKAKLSDVDEMSSLTQSTANNDLSKSKLSDIDEMSSLTSTMGKITHPSSDLATGILKVRRFRSASGTWKNNGPDAISFKCSHTVKLYGIQVFTCFKGTNYSDIQIKVFDKNDKEIHEDVYKVASNKYSNVCDVMLRHHVRIQAGELYTIQTYGKGSPVHCGRDGMTTVTVDDVTFNFVNSSKSMNGTDVTIGQIPSLLFKKY